MDAHAAESELMGHGRLHGRRRGRKLRGGQQRLLAERLPAYRLTPGQLGVPDPRTVFDPAPSELWLEIGFGAGEHAAWQAAARPDIGLIACEVFQTGIVALLSRIEHERLGNIKLVTDDARDLLDALPDASIDRGFILFPDPWPKLRHHKRRLIDRSRMVTLARVLRDGAELRIATDDTPYLREILAVACADPAFEWLARHPADWRERSADWPPTRYEAKAIASGRPPAFLRFRRNTRNKMSAEGLQSMSVALL